MTTPARVPPWFPPVSLVVIAILTWTISFSSYRFNPFVVTGQICLLLVALRAFCYWPPMVRLVSSMPVPHRLVFGFMIMSMILGHYTLTARTYFPYVSWEIFPFVNERDPVTCRQFLATTESGKKVRLLVEQLFPSIVQIFALDDPKHYTPEMLDHLALAVAKEYNKQHPDDPVRQVDLVVVSVSLHPPASDSPTQPSCELLKHYAITSARSN